MNIKSKLGPQCLIRASCQVYHIKSPSTEYFQHYWWHQLWAVTDHPLMIIVNGQTASFLPRRLNNSSPFRTQVSVTQVGLHTTLLQCSAGQELDYQPTTFSSSVSCYNSCGLRTLEPVQSSEQRNVVGSPHCRCDLSSRADTRWVSRVWSSLAVVLIG